MYIVYKFVKNINEYTWGNISCTRKLFETKQNYFISNGIYRDGNCRSIPTAGLQEVLHHLFRHTTYKSLSEFG